MLSDSESEAGGYESSTSAVYETADGCVTSSDGLGSDSVLHDAQKSHNSGSESEYDSHSDGTNVDSEAEDEGDEVTRMITDARQPDRPKEERVYDAPGPDNGEGELRSRVLQTLGLLWLLPAFRTSSLTVAGEVPLGMEPADCVLFDELAEMSHHLIATDRSAQGGFHLVIDRFGVLNILCDYALYQAPGLSNALIGDKPPPFRFFKKLPSSDDIGRDKMRRLWINYAVCMEKRRCRARVGIGSGTAITGGITRIAHYEKGLTLPR